MARLRKGKELVSVRSARSVPLPAASVRPQPLTSRTRGWWERAAKQGDARLLRTSAVASVGHRRGIGVSRENREDACGRPVDGALEDPRVRRGRGNRVERSERLPCSWVVIGVEVWPWRGGGSS